MTFPTTIKGQKVALQIGDGGDPETFAIICGITTKGLQRTRQTQDTVIWDCDDPDAPPEIVRDILQGDWTMTGSGQATTANLDQVEAAYNAGTLDNWQLVFFSTGSTVSRSYTGGAIVTDLTLGAVNGERASISITLSGSGALTTATP